MKKSALLLGAMLLILSLTACGRNAEQDISRNETVQEPAISLEPTEEPQEETISSEMENTEPDTVSTDFDGIDSIEASDETANADETEVTDETEAVNEAEGGKTLVVYFSATGNTQEAAGYIAEAVGGELFELVPVEPYSDEDLNYNNKNSRVVYEHDNPEARTTELVEATVADWESYDTVFIGYAGGIIGLN